MKKAKENWEQFLPGYLHTDVLPLLPGTFSSYSRQTGRRHISTRGWMLSLLGTWAAHPPGPAAGDAGMRPGREQHSGWAAHPPAQPGLLPRLLFWSDDVRQLGATLSAPLRAAAAAPLSSRTISDPMPSSEQRMFSKIALSAVSILLANLRHLLSSLMQFVPGKTHKQTNPSIPSSWKEVFSELLPAAAAGTRRRSGSVCSDQKGGTKQFEMFARSQRLSVIYWKDECERQAHCTASLGLRAYAEGLALGGWCEVCARLGRLFSGIFYGGFGVNAAGGRKWCRGILYHRGTLQSVLSLNNLSGHFFLVKESETFYHRAEKQGRSWLSLPEPLLFHLFLLVIVSPQNSRIAFGVYKGPWICLNPVTGERTVRGRVISAK